jgi:SAM-dependent methyltransferase
MPRFKKGGRIRHAPGDVSKNKRRPAYGGSRKTDTPFKKRKKRKKQFPTRRIPRGVVFDDPIKGGKTEFDTEEKTIPRKKTITSEQRALLDEKFEKISEIETRIRQKKSEIKEMEAELRRDYNKLSANGRADYFRRIYDNFSEVYDYVMKSTGHFAAIREVLQITRKFLKPPILDITAGTYEVLKYALELMNVRKNLQILLNQYKLLLENVPKCPVLESEEYASKIERAIDSVFPEQTRGYFNKGAEFLFWANEISPKMASIGKKKTKGFEIKHTSFNATELPEKLEGQFMTVICAQTFHLISKEDKMNLIKSIFRALKPGGYAIIIEEDNFRISPSFDIRGVGIPLRAVACPIDKKSDFISMFTRFEDKDGKIIGFEYTGIGSKMNVDKKPGHIMRSYVFRKPLTAGHLADAVTGIYDSQVEEGKRGPAHGSIHSLRCGIAAAEYIDRNPDELEVDNKEALMQAAAITGLLHDFIRKAHDGEGRKGSQITADMIEYLAGSNPDAFDDKEVKDTRRKLAESYPEEMRILTDFLKEYPDYVSMISQVIRINDESADEVMAAADKIEKKGLSEHALLCKSLMYANMGTEGIGESVIVRRAQHVSGVRSEDSEDLGALKSIIDRHGFNDREFKLLTFLGDSMVRMYSENAVENLPSDDLWDNLKKVSQIEAKVYDSLVYYFEENHDWEEREIFDFLLNCGFPGMEQCKERILARITDDEKFEPDRTFADDSVRMVTSLAYSQSRDEGQRLEGELIMDCITDNEIKSILEESNIDELKKRFSSYFG